MTPCDPLVVVVRPGVVPPVVEVTTAGPSAVDVWLPPVEVVTMLG